jgi:hypothetical protein
MRRGEPPLQASKKVGLSLAAARRNTNALYKVGDRWKVRKSDHVPRQMLIYENGRKETVEFADSRTASLIAEYFNCIKTCFETHNFYKLIRFRKKTFRDINGRRHRLDTNPRSVIILKSSDPHPEHFKLYRR